MEPALDGTNNPSDAESMLASALLEIRSDTRGEVNNPSSAVVAPAAVRPQMPPSVPVPPAVAAAAAAPVRAAPSRTAPKKTRARAVAETNPIAPGIPTLPTPTAPATPGVLPYGVPTGTMFSPEQVAALRAAAAAASAASLAAASTTPNPLAPPTPNPLGSQLGLFQQAAALGGAAAAAASGIPAGLQHPQTIAAAAAARAMAPGVPPPPPPPPVVPGAVGHAAGVVVEDSQPLPPPRVSPPDTAIRRDQVEAALKSKPQRGRKREDLSELERLELTRTRNREHAKSTRIRKKARHQELLDIEKKFDLMEKQFSLRSKRQAVLAEFLRVRETMLHNFRPSDGSLSSGEYTVPAGNKTLSSSWEELVESTSEFQFDEGWKHEDGPMLSAAERMHRFDEYVHGCVLSKFGGAMIPMLRYNFKGENDGIALDFANSGLAEVELSLALPNKILLTTGIVRFRFEPNSEKLRSVAYVSSMDHLASSERLNVQISYPSTVSLDPPAVLGDQTKAGEAKDDAAGPGMSI